MTVYYVAPTGSDAAQGAEQTPWRTISRAVSELGPGDEVVVGPGTYVEQVWIARGGDAGADVTIRAEPRGGARVMAPEGAYSTLNIRANHVVLDGFDVTGGGGHAVDAEHVHHTKVLNMVAHDSGGSGISFVGSEFITIEGNETYGNAATNGYQTSGISVYQARNITGDTTTPGYRTILRNNVSHDNVESEVAGEHTDGNGIIIDDFQSTQNGDFGNYTYPTLVENNLVYRNGGKGIQVTWSDNVTVRNNTAWHNNTDAANPGTWRGELSNQMSDDNSWINNIAVADPRANPDNTAVGDYGDGNTGVTWVNTITFNGTPGEPSLRLDGGNRGPVAAEGNLLGVDPGLAGPPEDFHPGAGSAAIDAGTAEHGVGAVDLDGGARVKGVVDIGAYESSALGAPWRYGAGPAGAETATVALRLVDGGPLIPGDFSF